MEITIEMVRKATELDGAGKYSEAILMYKLSLENFQKLVDAESSTGKKGILLQKMKEYSDRVAVLEKQTGSISSTPKPKITAPEVVTAPPSIDWVSMQKQHKEKQGLTVSQEKENPPSEPVDIKSNLDDLSKATKEIERAKEYDNENNYTLAFQHYNLALEYFVKALEVEKGASTQKFIKERVKDYLTRAEQLKQLLQSSKSSTLTNSSSSNSKLTQSSSSVSAAPVSATILENAINLVEEAMDFDEAEKYDEAIAKYENALALFAEALRVESKAEVKSLIKDKVIDYTTRVEQLKQYKLSGSFTTNPIQFGLNPGQSKYKPPPIVKRSQKGIFGKKTWDKF